MIIIMVMMRIMVKGFFSVLTMMTMMLSVMMITLVAALSAFCVTPSTSIASLRSP